MIRNARRAALGIFSGKNILNFGVQKRLRAFLNPIFTRGIAFPQNEKPPKISLRRSFV